MGVLLDAVVEGLNRLPETHLPKLPRMADFALWATAAEASFGLNEGTFLAAYQGNRMSSHELVIEADPLGGPRAEIYIPDIGVGTTVEFNFDFSGWTPMGTMSNVQ